MKRRDHIDMILAKYDCDLQLGANRKLVIVLAPRSTGQGRTNQLLRDARAEVEAFYPGVTMEWLS